MAKKLITMTEDEFYEKYNLIKNHLDTDSAFDGFMFETYGEEVKFVEDHIDCPVCKRNIWTILEVEGNLYFVSGFHYVNRFGYLLTEELVDEDVEIEVKIDTEVDDDSNESGPFDQLGYEATSDED